MEELVRKFLYTGVGIASLTAEKVQEAVDELIGKGKVSKEEGEKIVDGFFDQVEDRKQEVEDKFTEITKNFSKSLNLPEFITKKDLEDIAKRLDALEAKVGLGAKEEVKEVVKKSTTRAKKTTTKKTEDKAK